MTDAIVYVHELDKLEDQLQTCQTYCGLYDLRIVECTVGDRAHAIAEARRRSAVLVTTTITNLGDTVQAVAKAAAIVDVVSIREGIDSTTAMGRLVMNVLTTVHQYYIETGDNDANQ